MLAQLMSTRLHPSNVCVPSRPGPPEQGAVGKEGGAHQPQHRRVAQHRTHHPAAPGAGRHSAGARSQLTVGERERRPNLRHLCGGVNLVGARQLLSRGGRPNRWHSLVYCEHGDSTTGRN
jgi:hypothetical protein